MVGKAILFIALTLGVGACKGKEKAPQGEPVAASEVVVFDAAAARAVEHDAGATPSAEDAAVVLRAFSGKLLGDDLPGARENLRVPPEFKDKQVDYFLQELQAPENLSQKGVDAVLAADFGPLADRFGEQAEGVAAALGVPIGSLYAFGDASSAAVLVWDGQRFLVAAIHKLVVD
jgi:hypothetical protein